jgi:hypothetical protein
LFQGSNTFAVVISDLLAIGIVFGRVDQLSLDLGVTVDDEFTSQDVKRLATEDERARRMTSDRI